MSWRLALLTALCLSCNREVRGPHRASSPPAASPVAPEALDEEERWLRLAFGYADTVAVVRLTGEVEPGGGAPIAETLDELRGFKTPARMVLDGLEDAAPADLAAGRQWIVATTRARGAAPAGYVLARLPDSPAERRHARALTTSPWRYAPVVALVRVADLPLGDEVEGGRVVLDVTRVLAGELPARVTDNAWDFPKWRPFVADGQTFVLTAWGFERTRYAKFPMVNVEALTPIAPDDFAALEREVAAGPRAALLARAEAGTRALADAGTAFAFHSAARVAAVQVVATADEPTNCGGLHYVMAASTWLRGAPARCPAALDYYGGVLPGGDFVGGGHCYRGPERMGQHLLVGAQAACGAPTVSLPDSPDNRARVASWLAAGGERFAALPVGSDVIPGAGRVAAFEPEVPFESAPGGFVHFEVVARDAHSVHCRAAPPSEIGEWVFTGAGLPDWEVGSRHWGYPIHGSLPRLFVPSLFLPDAPARLMDELMRAVARVAGER